MKAFDTINLGTLEDTLVSLTVAFLMGALIGLERQIRQRTAGLRTNVLVCVGAALFVDIAVRFHELNGGSPGPLQVIAYVVSGVGFLGAGVIMRDGGSVRGINTAATLWGSAAVGCAAGADLILEAFLGTAFVLAANTLLRPIIMLTNRRPIHSASVEAIYRVTLIADAARLQEARALLERLLGAAGLPIHAVDTRAFGAEEAEIEAELAPSEIAREELDVLTDRLRNAAYVNQAFWSASTAE